MDLVSKLSLQEIVQIDSYKPIEEIHRLMLSASVFCLPSVVAMNGDLDGIPFVLMEAMALEKACVSTNVSGIPELIDDGSTGCLVPPQDTATLADALAALISDPQRRLALGAAGQAALRRDFNAERGIERLAVKFRLRTLAAAIA